MRGEDPNGLRIFDYLTLRMNILKYKFAMSMNFIANSAQCAQNAEFFQKINSHTKSSVMIVV